MNCNCETYKQIIKDVFRVAGYNDIYNGDVTLMAGVLVQGLRKDMRALRLYREAGDAALQAVDLMNKPTLR